MARTVKDTAARKLNQGQTRRREGRGRWVFSLAASPLPSFSQLTSIPGFVIAVTLIFES